MVIFMKQSEKSQITYNKILNSAIKEFGTKNYDSASINNICSDNDISKGLIYHNFKNKDELYLRCTEEAFKSLLEFLEGNEYEGVSFSESMKKLIDSRYEFFSKNTYYSHIFFNAVLQPPKHLAGEIKEIRSSLDEFNQRQYRSMLKDVTLRDGISPDEALSYFLIFQEMFNGYYQRRAYEQADFHSLIKEHELALSKILNIMLYGIAKEKEL